MLNRRFSRASAIVAIALSVAILASGCAHTFSPNDVLDRAYGPYDIARSCWLVYREDPFLKQTLPHCVKLDSARKIATASGTRWYVFASASAIEGAVHSSSGFVGAFVLEQRAGKWTVMASEAQFNARMGQGGSAPENPTLVALGPDDFYGWITSEEYCYQGYCGSAATILAPKGSAIVELANFGDSTDDLGVSGDENLATTLTATVEPDTSAPATTAYPLRVTVQGTVEGKKAPTETWTFPFDTTLWRYRVPEDYPMSRMNGT
jgi:hypothetical protein